jgi:hypothetical protein
MINMAVAKNEKWKQTMIKDNTFRNYEISNTDQDS